MQQQILPELWIEILCNLFDGLNEEWQFSTLVNCSLVCKGWHRMLNWQVDEAAESEIVQLNLWKILAKKHSILFDSNDKILDMREVFAKSVFPAEHPTADFESDSYNGMNGLNYVSGGKTRIFKIKFNTKICGINFLKRMIEHDMKIRQLFAQFMKEIMSIVVKSSPAHPFNSYEYSGVSFNEKVIKQRYEYFTSDEQSSYFPQVYADRSFEDVKQEYDSILFNCLKKAISGDESQEEISTIDEMESLIKRECPIVAEYQQCRIGILGSLAVLFITNSGKCIFYEHSSED